MATSKPDILMVLLSKLTQEGDKLYKVTWLHANIFQLRIHLFSFYIVQLQPLHQSETTILLYKTLTLPWNKT